MNFFDGTALQVKQIDDEAFNRLEQLKQMFDQLARRQLPVRREFVGRAGEIFDDCLLLFAQIGVAQLRAHFLGFDLTEAGVDGNARDPVLERHFTGELGKLLKNFDENHLAKILFTSSSRSMRADHFRDKRIKTANQFPSRRIIVPKGSLNQLSRVEISHVAVEIVSTLLTETGVDGLRLQIKTPNPRLQAPGKRQLGYWSMEFL